MAAHAGSADGRRAAGRRGAGRGADAAAVEPIDARAGASSAELVNEAGDDRDDIQPGDRVLLIVENDLGFAKVLLDAAREKGFKGLVTRIGAAALAMIARVPARRRSRSTSSCPTSRAGACSSG